MNRRQALAGLSALTVSLAAPNRSFALWDIEIVSKERAKELGMEVRSTAAGPNLLQVELEFKAEGELKNFTQDPLKNFGRVELRSGKGDNLALAAPLREDRSKPGRVVVSFTADTAQLDKLTLGVMVPETDGGSIYDLRVKDFVEMK